MSKRKTAVTDRMPSVQASPFLRLVRTPGPWEVGNNWSDIYAGNIKIAQVTFSDGYDRMIPNARLIAAAPDLEEALRSIVSETDGGKRGCCGATISRACSALQKALGK